MTTSQLLLIRTMRPKRLRRFCLTQFSLLKACFSTRGGEYRKQLSRRAARWPSLPAPSAVTRFQPPRVPAQNVAHCHRSLFIAQGAAAPCSKAQPFALHAALLDMTAASMTAAPQATLRSRRICQPQINQRQRSRRALPQKKLAPASLNGSVPSAIAKMYRNSP